MSGNPYESPQKQGSVDPQPIDAPPQSELFEPNPDARNWAMFAHLASLAGYTAIPLANVLGPLIVWLIKKDEMPFVDDQGKEAINFQLSMTIYLIVSGVLILCGGIGIIGLIVCAIVDLAFTIVAAVTVSSGKAYRYPLTIRLVK